MFIRNLVLHDPNKYVCAKCFLNTQFFPPWSCTSPLCMKYSLYEMFVLVGKHFLHASMRNVPLPVQSIQSLYVILSTCNILFNCGLWLDAINFCSSQAEIQELTGTGLSGDATADRKLRKILKRKIESSWSSTTT